MIGQIRIDRPILVVDDTNSTRYSTVRFLRAAGVEVIEATTGAQALALAPTCGAIVLDVNLPDIDGFEVCRHLRAGMVNTRVPVIHLSAQRLREEDKIRGLESGADAYLTHPVDPGVLSATINALLRARAAEYSEKVSRARFEAVFRNAPVGIALLDADGRVVEANDAMRAIVEDMADGSEDTRLSEVAGEIVRHCSFAADHSSGPVFVSPSGQERPLHLNCRVTGLDHDTRLLLAVDVTAEHELQLDKEGLLQSERDARRDAEEASRAKDSFLALLSHELRNPLAPISSATHLLQHAPGDLALVERASGVIARQVTHMRNLIDDLMDVSRVTRGLVKLDRAPVALQDIVQAAVEQTRPLVDARRHALVLRLAEAPVTVNGDRTRLIQVVANLLNNAAKYTPTGGRITVRLRADGGSAVLGISDTGMGMATELLPRVFDLFTQAERTPDRSQGGLGVGLALVKSVVQLHDGSVAASSEGTGRGSTFTVVMPLSAASPAEVGVSAPVRAAGALDILLVDDNQDAASTLADVLRGAGHFVDVAHDPTQALRDAALRARPHEVYILDIGLPGMTGYDLLRGLRLETGAAPRLAIALTGYGQPADRASSAEAGFDTHLVKPVHEDTLLALLASGAARMHS